MRDRLLELAEKARALAEDAYRAKSAAEWNADEPLTLARWQEVYRQMSAATNALLNAAHAAPREG